MKVLRRCSVVLIAAAGAAAGVVVALSLASCSGGLAPGRVLSGTVTDAANGMSVNRARIVFDGRTTTLYTARDFRLTHLSGAGGILTVDAAGYEPFQKQVVLRGRETRVDIALQGREVPGLAGILAWCAWEPESLRIDIRLIDSAGVTLQHFPALRFSATARLFVNLGTDDRPRPGARLYEGPVSIVYDPSVPLDRLKGRIPRASIAAPPAGAERGMLEISLVTPQGSYAWTRGDVPLSPGREP